MNTLDRWIDRQIMRLTLGQFLYQAAEWLAGFLFAFGAAVLVVKLLLPGLWPHVLWSAAAVVPVTAAAWWLSRRRSYTRSEAAALLDRRMGMGGLLMTLSERPDDRWEEQLPGSETAWRESLPKVRPVRFARYLALPMVFALGACCVPLREAAVAAPQAQKAAGQQATGQLEEMLAALDEARVLEEEEQEQLREEIEKFAEETQDAPLTHEKWETADALRERMRMRLESAAMTVTKAQSALAALSDAAHADAEPLSIEQTEELEKTALEALRKLAENGALEGESGKGLSSELKKLLKSRQGKLPGDPGQRQEMLAELQEFLEQEAKQLGECRGKCSGGMLSELKGNGGFDSTQREVEEGMPGRGGVTRGRGDADLTYGEESDEKGTRFKEVVLPPGYLDSPGEQVVGTTAAPPTVEPAESAPRAGPRASGAASGNETWDRDLRPRHRRVVRDYFGGEQRP